MRQSGAGMLGLALLGLGVGVLRGKDPPAEPIPATVIRVPADAGLTVKTALAALREAGFDVEGSGLDSARVVPGRFRDAPFWEAVETLAEAAGTRITLREQGRKILLEKRQGPSQERSSLSGPFRVVARRVNGRLDLENGDSFQEVELLVHWEPRFPVFRMDSVPRIEIAQDDLGQPLRAATVSSKSPLHSTFEHTLAVRLFNVPRKAQAIGELSGSFQVTASRRMLPFRFSLSARLPLAGVLPKGIPAEGVEAVLTDWELLTLNGRPFWEATLRLSYPPGLPVFQSFETWLGENRLRLLSPDGRVLLPDQAEEPPPGREMILAYRFDAAKLGGTPKGEGWSLIYETPAPLVEFPVSFRFKNIPLP